ncbi:glutamyl-tRNA(Gln) amidotransferase subunit A [Luteitalea sp. TBR-22]|uniref:amidase n=1 Tax=Luteitalea sp. TBR-22 TaxID=2802971 RepID=UPI001AFB23F9|nr:amidase [Luteitalea sp. TBR-22]BCS31671.1 glutamyl-tRNA(Gln) amidotransferase subunit A [Luteitalea sp. TBR-22]
MPTLTRRAFAASLVTVAAAPRLVARQAIVRPAAATELAWLSLADAAALVRSRKVSPVELTAACLDRIATYDPKLNAFITVTREAALAQAKVLETEAVAGRFRGPLHGVPVALKDNIDTAGVRTTAASAVFDDRVPKEDAEVVRRLTAAGAVMLGKLNLHEFANGGTSATSYYGPVRNPWALDRNPGGSSGGSAAAVAAALCYGALGTDTGGSIRTPSSYCGIVGLKPTYGLVSIRGIVPLVLSLDHCGPMTRTVGDAALMLQALAGYDRLDIASVEHAAEDYVSAARQSVKGLRVGVARVPFFDHLDTDVARAVDAALTTIATLTGTSPREVVLPSAAPGSLGAEMYAYHEPLFTRMAQRYQIPTRRNLNGDRDARAADYIRGHWTVELIRRTIDDSFADVDLVVLPTRRRTPRTVDAALQREEKDVPRNPELENTGHFNVYGIPAISVPCGFTTAGLPVGLMIAGPRFSEGRVLALARAYEAATDWHTRRPALSPDTPVPPLKRTESDDRD